MSYYYTDKITGEELFNNYLFGGEHKGSDKLVNMNCIMGDIVWRLHTKELKGLIDYWLDCEQDTVDEGTDYTEQLQQLEAALFYVLICSEETHADYAKQWERVTQLLTMTPHERAGKEVSK